MPASATLSSGTGRVNQGVVEGADAPGEVEVSGDRVMSPQCTVEECTEV